MTDITLKNITNPDRLSTINDNFEILESVVNTEVIHSVGGNNIMSQDFDMNSKKILNLPKPVDPTDPVRLQDLGNVNVNITTDLPLNFYKTMSDLNSSVTPVVAGDVVELIEFTSGGGGGDGWRATGNIIAASQTPAQTGGPTCSDANGNEFSLVHGGVVSVASLGAVGDGATDNLAIFNAAANGNIAYVPKPTTSYNLSSTPTGTFIANESITLAGAGSGLTIGYFVTTNQSNNVTQVPSIIRIATNNTGGLQGFTEFSTFENMVSFDADGNMVLGAYDPRMYTLHSVPFNGKKNKYIEAHEFSSISSFTAAEIHAMFAGHGINESAISTGSSITNEVGFARSTVNLNTGNSAADAGWLLDIDAYAVATSSFDIMELMFDIPTGLDLRLEFGLWDGTLTNAIWIERFDSASVKGTFVAYCAKGGVTTSLGMSVGNDELRHSVRIHKLTNTSIEFYDSNSDVAAGQFQLKATIATNVPDAVNLRPFIRFRGNGTPPASRAARIDKISLIGNW